MQEVKRKRGQNPRLSNPIASQNARLLAWSKLGPTHANCVNNPVPLAYAEELTRATEQFYMGETSRSSKDHYGMGLYITQSIVEMHNGTLVLANDPDTGAGQVTIEIPH